MKPLISLAPICSLIVLAASPASADEPTTLSSGYASAGVASSLYLLGQTTGFQLEGGVRLANRIYLHGGVEAGSAVQRYFEEESDDTGSYTRARLGLEVRTKWVFAGVDTGVEHIVMDERPMVPRERYTATLAIPRVGLGIGSGRLRARIAAELPLAFADGLAGAGLGFSAGLGCAF